MIEISIINDELYIETENVIHHTNIKNTNWEQVKNAIILEFFEKSWWDLGDKWDDYKDQIISNQIECWEKKLEGEEQ